MGMLDLVSLKQTVSLVSLAGQYTRLRRESRSEYSDPVLDVVATTASTAQPPGSSVGSATNVEGMQSRAVAGGLRLPRSGTAPQQGSLSCTAYTTACRALLQAISRQHLAGACLESGGRVPAPSVGR